MAQAGRWYFEPIRPDLIVGSALDEVIYKGKTRYQDVQILRLSGFGLCLVLDGKTQSAEADEYIYHEALVHPSLVAHTRPERVFIGGGGEGATLREVLRHRSVRRVVMVDLDREVVEICRRFLPGHHQGAFDDPRAELVFGDARAYLNDTRESFDVIILDLADPIEGGPAYLLYTREFYRVALARLSPGGILVTQAGATDPLSCEGGFSAIAHTVASVFPGTLVYTVFVPAFGSPWGFAVGLAEPLADAPTADEVDKRLRERLAKGTRFYDGITHVGMFSLPRYLREGLRQETRVATDEDPVFVT
jgi:spermidine synthase